MNDVTIMYSILARIIRDIKGALALSLALLVGMKDFNNGWNQITGTRTIVDTCDESKDKMALADIRYMIRMRRMMRIGKDLRNLKPIR